MSLENDKRSTKVFQRLDLYQSRDYSFRDYLKRWLWEWTQLLLIRPSFRRAHGWRRFWLRVFGATISPTCTIDPGFKVLHPWLLSIGRHSMIGPCTVWNPGEVTIGDQAVVSQDACLCSGSHDYTVPEFPLKRNPVRIGNGVWIAAGAFIGPGAVIGDNSVVGARSVVMGEVESGVVVAGNPARVIKPRPMNSPGDRTLQSQEQS